MAVLLPESNKLYFLVWQSHVKNTITDHKQSGVKGKKIRLTYAFTSNADGSEKLQPFIIGKAARPRAFNKQLGAQLGFYYCNNAKAWMTAHLYQDWIEQWDHKLQAEGRKILLLQDNFSGHIIPSNLQNIHVENFQPNLTAHVQPKDQGIIRCFKAHYRAKFIQQAINQYDEGITPANIYNINQLQAMQMADEAWKEVDTTTIRNCWCKAEISPDLTSTSSCTTQPSIPISSLVHDTSSQMDLIVEAERQVQIVLDDLVAAGALQTQNQIDINALLNPDGESQVLTETSDKEIYHAVMDSIKARENIDINGGDDVDDDSPLEPHPTRREVLRVLSTIGKCIEASNDPIAHKLDALMGTFSQQLRLNETQSMRPTLVTDFFQKS
jgi:DDE superfamily endonuclease